MKLPVLQAKRPCAGCTACCSVLGVAPLDKQPFEPCKHCVETGCGIYETRPKICGEFDCLWQGGTGEEQDRPDRLGVIFAPTNGPVDFTGQIEIQAYEVVPNAFASPRVVAVAKLFTAHGLLVIGHVHGGGRFRFMGPADKIAKAQRWAESTLDKPSRA